MARALDARGYWHAEYSFTQEALMKNLTQWVLALGMALAIPVQAVDQSWIKPQMSQQAGG